MSDLLSPDTPSSERDSVSIEMKLPKSSHSQGITNSASTTVQNMNSEPPQIHPTDHYDDLLLGGSMGVVNGDFASLMSSPVFNGNMNFLPTVSNGIFDLGSCPNTPQLPPLDSDLIQHLGSIEESVPLEDPTLSSSYTLPTLPNIQGMDHNVPPPSDDMNWQMFCQLIGQKNDSADATVHGIPPPSCTTTATSNPYAINPIPFAHQSSLVGEPSLSSNNNLPPSAIGNETGLRVDAVGEKKLDGTDQKALIKPRAIKSLSPHLAEEEDAYKVYAASPAKKRKLNNGSTSSSAMKEDVANGRPRKSVIKKEEEEEEGATKGKKSRKRGRRKKKKEDSESNDELDMEQFLSQQLSGESFVGIRTEDGEVRIQIPPSSSRAGAEFSKVKFTVFGNACSDKIEDILQPKKRTRYVRGLSEDEKKQRRREQNRNAAARSRARKNAMISKVIQLHQENMGLRAFVAENITQTKILRDEISRLNQIQQAFQFSQYSMQSHPSSAHSSLPGAQPPAPPSSTDCESKKKSSLFDILSDDI